MAEPLPPIAHIGTSASERNTKKMVLGCSGCALLAGIGIVILVLGVVMMVSTAMKSTDAYQRAYQIATSSPEVQQAIGTPIKDGFLPSGSINGLGQAELSISISGPNGKGTVQVSATKIPGGDWNYTLLECSIPKTGRIVNLKPDAAPTP